MATPDVRAPLDRLRPRCSEVAAAGPRRRLRRIKAALRSELVGSAEPAQSDLGLIQAAAMATVMLRDMEERFAAGDAINPTDFVLLPTFTLGQ